MIVSVSQHMLIHSFDRNDSARIYTRTFSVLLGNLAVSRTTYAERCSARRNFQAWAHVKVEGPCTLCMIFTRAVPKNSGTRDNILAVSCLKFFCVNGFSNMTVHES